MRTALLAALACLVGCQPQPDGTPEGAYRAFVAAAGKGEDAVAFGQLTSASQEAVKGRLVGVATASGASMGEDAAAVVFKGGGRGSPITDIRVLKMEQDRATVAVTARGQTQAVNLHREGSEWRVEVPRLQGGQP
jgi:hypothetical protein